MRMKCRAVESRTEGRVVLVSITRNEGTESERAGIWMEAGFSFVCFAGVETECAEKMF